MNDKKRANESKWQKQMKGWQIIFYVMQTPAHPSGGIIQRRDWVFRLQWLGNFRAGLSALRRKLRWAPHSRHSTPFPSPFQAIIWAGFGTVESNVSVSNSNCMQRHEYLPVTLLLGYGEVLQSTQGKKAWNGHNPAVTSWEQRLWNSDWNRMV